MLLEDIASTNTGLVTTRKKANADSKNTRTYKLLSLNALMKMVL